MTAEEKSSGHRKPAADVRVSVLGPNSGEICRWHSPETEAAMMALWFNPIMMKAGVAAEVCTGHLARVCYAVHAVKNPAPGSEGG